MWTALVDLVRATIFAGSHVLGGSLGTSVVVVSVLVRLALLPLALRSARFARVQQARLAKLRPQLERLKSRYGADPRRLLAETNALYRQHDVRLVGGSSIVSAVVSLPLLGALFSAVRNGLGARVRFLWIADLSRVEALLVILVGGLAGLAATTTPAAPESLVSTRTLTVTVIAGTVLFLWSASSAVALSIGAGSAVSILQNWLLRRDARRAPTSV